MKPVILVVEDEALVGDDVQRTLIKLGYEVPMVLASGKEALAAVERLRPSMVLMDIQLQGAMDGIQAAQVIRDTFATPVVYLTSHSDDGTLNRAKQTQPYGYLLKPFNDRELRTAIEVALHKHELESRLADRERWFSTTLQSIGDAVIATDTAEVITFMNGVAEQVTGWNRTNAIGKKVDDVLRLVNIRGEPIQGPVRRALRDSFAVQLPPSTDLLVKDGSQIAIDDSAAPIVDDKGKLLGGVVVFRDITERKKLELRVAQSERMASIGTMAAGMAHEINNPLAAVLANLSYSSTELQRIVRAQPALTGRDGHPVLLEVLDALVEASQAGDRVRRIVHDMKKFARADHVQKHLLDLPDVLDTAIKMVDGQIRHHAALSRSYGVTPFVEANEGRLVQVFTNLLVNAGQAIPESGPKNVRHEVRITTSTDEAGRAVVAIQDTGSGIAPADLGHIFDPFFTTKDVGEGTGLGLAICHGVVAALGGEITVQSTVGFGTCVRVALPPASRAIETAPVVVAESHSGFRGRVLVIDDDDIVARAVDRVLRHQHDVVTVSTGQAALGLISRTDFDTVLCDLMMPEMSGIDVYDAVNSVSPEMAKRFVFLTGGAFSARSKAFLQSVGNLVLYKPFSVDELRSAVSTHVDGARKRSSRN